MTTPHSGRADKSLSLSDPRHYLSALEWEVLRLTAGGYRIPDIAAAIGRPYKTIENAKSRIKAKLACAQMRDCVQFGTRLGWFARRRFDHRLDTEDVPTYRLTPRQIEVLYHLSLGADRAQVAQLLHLSEATVKNHVTACRSALGLHTTAGCVGWALRQKLIL